MRTSHVVTIALSILGAGAAGWLARDLCNATAAPDAPSPTGGPTAPAYSQAVDGYLASSPILDSHTSDDRSTDLTRRIEALAGAVGAMRGEHSRRWESIEPELAALKTQIAEIARTQEAIAKKAGVPAAWPSDPAEVEKIRERWRSKLEEAFQQLRAAYPQGPDPRGDVGVWSRFDEHQRARTALEAATDSASLHALSEGAFRGHFTMPR